MIHAVQGEEVELPHHVIKYLKQAVVMLHYCLANHHHYSPCCNAYTILSLESDRAAGDADVCAAADVSSPGGDSSADVYAWGGNQFGQLGLGDTVAKVMAMECPSQ